MKRIVIILALFIPLLMKAQTQLTLQSAIDTALKNNLDIQIAKNYVQIAKVSNNYGYAGGLPYINATAGDNLSVNSLSQEIYTGRRPPRTMWWAMTSVRAFRPTSFCSMASR